MHAETPIEKILRLDETHKKALGKIRVETIRDLLYYFPTRYGNISEIKVVRDLVPDETVTIYGQFFSADVKRNFKTKMTRTEGQLWDTTGKIRVIWFNQPFMKHVIESGANVELTGKVTLGKRGMYLANPEMRKIKNLPIDSHNTLFAESGSLSFQERAGVRLFAFPVYPETRGLSSRFLHHALQKIFKRGFHLHIPDPIPDFILEKYKLPKLATALVWIHNPEKKDHAEAARKRFAFEEIFMIQLRRQFERKQYESLFSYRLEIPHSDIADFISRFPFTPTQSQTDAINSVLNDFQMDKPMSRLIEGDVGSGKTFVAATVAYATIKNRPVDAKGKAQDFGNLQVAYMAPTEVLATQLFENFIEYFKHTGISIGLITGSGCRKFPTKIASAQKPYTEISRTQLLKWIKNGEIPIVIGTHALIQKSVDFQDLGLVIIDEQHRFGTNQRMKLAKKEGHAPHYLSMTATPIPRTLALTLYGDLDLTVIDQMPSGRKAVITEIVPDAVTKREVAYEAIRKELQAGRQAYVICSRISDPDPEAEQKLILKSVTSEAKRLGDKIFPEYKIGIMHSKMTPAKKDEVMKQFAHHDIDILVSTSVVEVGVNVPNATNIIIEGAERFGLAQLHQLRGRVLRGTHQAYCYLFADAKSEKTADRLKAFVKAKNGFELAELDLMQRGSGDLAGLKQWGISDLGMEAIKNIKMVEFARNEAVALVQSNSTLEKYPLLKEHVQGKDVMHFE